MITVGIDSGNRNTKAVILRDGEVIGRAITLTGFDANKSAENVYEKALADGRISSDEVASAAATGAGRKMIKFADDTITEISSSAKGILFVHPGIKIVIDLGSESSRAVKLSADGKIISYSINDKCAAGAGVFIETMARTLQVMPEEMGQLSLKHTEDVPMNSQCVVFAESEVVSLIHQKTAKEDIAYAIHKGIAGRIGSMVRQVGIVDGIALTGGPSLNTGLVQTLQNEIGKEIIVPEYSEYISALGAAIYASETAQ